MTPLSTDMPTRPAGSATTARATALVAERRPIAEALGTELAEWVNDPDRFATALRTAFERLADAAYRDGSQRVAPGLGPVHGVRQPLLHALESAFRRATRDDRPTTLLLLADRLFHERELEVRWFTFELLGRTLRADPERTWQLLRRAAREAGDWITVDSLAHPYATGIAAERYRWAELEQLVYSPSRWERRLVGSSIATMTHGHRATGREDELVTQALDLLGQLIGDAEPDVQKALSWAYRSLASIDHDATVAALGAQTDLAVAGDDGYRAWVIRDSLSKIDPIAATDLRDRLAGIRRQSGTPPTSSAAAMAARFGGLPDPINHPEPPLI